MGSAKGRLRLSLLATGLGFLLGALVLLATGRNPLLMFEALFRSVTGLNLSGGRFFNPRLIGEYLVQVMPICLTGLSVGFAFRAGLFNIGAEGQLMMGAAGAALVAALVRAPSWIHLPLAIMAALSLAALWGAIPGLLKAFLNVHEVVVTIMLNYAALYFSNWIILDLIGTVDRVKTAAFPPSALLQSPFLESITAGSRLNWGIVPTALAVLLSWFIMERTSFGYGLKATGFNKEAARAAGMKVRRDTVLSMAIAGAFAGLAGAVITLGTFDYARTLPSFEGYGMDGIAVALVGASGALGILLSSLLFGMLKAAGPLMQSAGIPRDIGGIISSSIVFLVAVKQGIDALIRRATARRAAPGAKVPPAEPAAGGGDP